jgi:flagellar protein FlgJ
LSIQTATDLILDVVRAADPAVAQRAEAMLEAASARKSEQAAATPAFQRQLLAATDTSAISVNSEVPAASDKSLEVYQKFEAMILQKFIGHAASGQRGALWQGHCRRNLERHDGRTIGAVLSKGGGIGIAARMMAIVLARPLHRNRPMRSVPTSPIEPPI